MKENVFTTKLRDIIIDEQYNSIQDIENLPAIFLVMDYHKLDLRKMIKIQKESGSMEEEHLLVLTYNILCAMQFIHSANIMHRDLKPSNLMVDEHCSVIICDFGMARSIEHDVVKSKLGTLGKRKLTHQPSGESEAFT